MNAYLVILDEDTEQTFVVFSSGPAEAARIAISYNVDDLPEQVSISLLCGTDHVLRTDIVKPERSAR